MSWCRCRLLLGVWAPATKTISAAAPARTAPRHEAALRHFRFDPHRVVPLPGAPAWKEWSVGFDRATSLVNVQTNERE